MNGRSAGKEKSRFIFIMLRPAFPIQKSDRFAKLDHVKTLTNRQVKAPITFAVLFSLCALNFPAPAAANEADSSRPAQTQANLVLLNGNVYTVNQKQPRAEAIVVK